MHLAEQGFDRELGIARVQRPDGQIALTAEHQHAVILGQQSGDDRRIDLGLELGDDLF